MTSFDACLHLASCIRSPDVSASFRPHRKSPHSTVLLHCKYYSAGYPSFRRSHSVDQRCRRRDRLGRRSAAAADKRVKICKWDLT